MVPPKPPVPRQESAEHAESHVADCAVEGDLTEAVERAQFLLAAIADLVLLVSDIEVAVTSRQSARETEPVGSSSPRSRVLPAERPDGHSGFDRATRKRR